jgi:hypothetical protein
VSEVTIDIVLITAILGFHHLLVLHGDKTLNSLKVHGEIEWNPEAREQSSEGKENTLTLRTSRVTFLVVNTFVTSITKVYLS